MKREYDSGTVDDARLFIGMEVERTPAYGLNTLFVVGIVNTNTIREIIDNRAIKHVYFGANHSFQVPKDNKNSTFWRDWNDMLLPFLKDSRLLVSLDFDIRYVEDVVEEAWVEFNNFIPIVSCKIPYIGILGYNGTLKIDDKDFNASNPGVWVHSLHDLMDRKKFTPWAVYGKDTIIK